MRRTRLRGPERMRELGCTIVGVWLNRTESAAIAELSKKTFTPKARILRNLFLAYLAKQKEKTKAS